MRAIGIAKVHSWVFAVHQWLHASTTWYAFIVYLKETYMFYTRHAGNTSAIVNLTMSWTVAMYLLNQVRTWFLKIDSVQIISMLCVFVYVCVCVCVCVCVSLLPRLLITSDVIRPKWLVKQFYSCYNMAIVVVTVNGHGLDIDICHRN